MLKMISLHNHDSWSFSDAILKTEEYVHQAAMLNAKSIGISNHANLSSWLDFQSACKKADIKPIASVEFYFFWSSEPQNRKSFHLLVTAMTEQGYRNLLKLIWLSNKPLDKGGGYYYRARINEKMLFSHKEGLAVGSACLSSPITSCLINNDEMNARIAADEFKREFGDKFFMEVFPHKLPIQAEANKKVVQLAKDMDIPLIVSLDVHFKDSSYEDIYLINGRNRRDIKKSDVDDPETDCLRSADFHFKDCECILDALTDHGLDRKDVLAAFDYSIQLDKQINFEYKDRFDLPSICEDPDRELEKMLSQRLIKRFGGREKIPTIYAERLRYEFTVVKDKNFSTYFLILEDAINFCRNYVDPKTKQQGIEIGVGRGSAGGCLIAYILDITDVDPILYNLPFERFLNPYRESAPDVDTDMSSEGRKKLFEYLQNRWGHENVVQIITFGEVKSKVAIKDVAKYLEMPFKEVNAITAAIPSKDYDDEGALVDVELKEALEIPAVQQYQRKNPRLFELALQLEGSLKTFGVHAGGLIITPKPAYECGPVMHKKTDDGADVPILGWDKKQAEKIGLVKYDFLGLSTLTILRECRDLTGKNIRHLPLDDEKTWQYFQNAKHMKAVFQFTEPKTCKYLRDAKPRNILELSAVNTGIRPGSDWDTFIKNKKANVVKPKFDLPIIRDTLRETYGAVLYQDDLLFLIKNLSELNLGQADLLRRAFEKNDKEKIAKYREQFVSTCVYPELAEDIFEWLQSSVGYLFAKAHAVAYSINGYFCAYFKSNYPAEFLVANLRHPKSNSKQSESEYIADFIAEAQEMGVNVELPRLNKAYASTTIDETGTVVYGLENIKGISGSSSKILASIQAEGFDDFVEKALSVKITVKGKNDYHERSTINKGHIKALCKIGFFGDPAEILVKYNEKFAEEEDTNISLEDAVNEAVNFEWFNTMAKKLASLPEKYQDTEKYLVVKVSDIKTGSKNGRSWQLIKGKSNMGEFSAFFEGPRKGDIILVKYSKGRNDNIKVDDWRLLP